MEALLETRQLTKQFGGITANKSINLTVKAGTTTGLIGPNGSGKTTLINQVSGQIPATSGRTFFKGQDITEQDANKIARAGIGRTFQRIRLFERLTVVENVLVARRHHFSVNLLDIVLNTGRNRREERQQLEYAMALLKRFKLESQAGVLPNSLPYGKRRALEIARALALEPELLLLDEPAAGMAKEEYADIMHIMEQLKEQGITMLLVEHTMEFIRRVVDWVYVLNFGEVISQGVFTDVEQDESVIKAYLGGDETL